ncbi:MAG TPA: hypothetical protein ENJ43_05815 [Gammaproteobacteria bacterium]|nr:hypothetical protein [Gammaproteobacteria bacterium]
MAMSGAKPVLRQGYNLGCRASQTGQGKAQSAGNGMPFPRSATRHWPVWEAPFGPGRKRSSAVLRSLELAMASPAVARLAANRFLTGCILNYNLDGVLATHIVATVTAILIALPLSAPAAISNIPLFISRSVDPNVLLNMSVEGPMGGAAYNDEAESQPDRFGNQCGGRIWDPSRERDLGVCYFKEREYLGYFNPKRCYRYIRRGGKFVPKGATNSNHECNGKFSGNFLNWATTSAIDMYIWTMTGGNRVVDTKSNTIIRQAAKASWWFHPKRISAADNVAPSTVTPWSESEVIIVNDPDDTGDPFKIRFERGDGTELALYNAKIRVCMKNKLESNCTPYTKRNGTVYYKPEGLIQQNAGKMRFALTSYTLDNSPQRDGGVLRANMKYVGPKMPDGSGNMVDNPDKEFGSDGLLIDNLSSSGGGCSCMGGGSSSYGSGIISYINHFSEFGYKSFDPVGELFYESLRYFKNLGRTPEYADGLTEKEKGGFPVITAWEDPIQYSCQKNFIVGINDAYSWMDKKLPGTYFTSPTYRGVPIDKVVLYEGTDEEITLISNDYGEPSNPDPDINVTALTNEVGALEGLNGTQMRMRCTSDPTESCEDNDGEPWNLELWKNVPALGEVFGPWNGGVKQNSYYVAGLAYYANTRDIRADLEGKQTVTTYMIDTQEYHPDPLVGSANMFWLAGKYGGFEDLNDNGQPDLEDEWDRDRDGEPDNYILANQPAKLVAGLQRSFNDIYRRLASFASVAANSTELKNGTRIYQARFNSGNWLGDLVAYDIEPDGKVGNIVWKASDQLPHPASRKIFSWNPAAPSINKGIKFRWRYLSAEQRAALNRSPNGTTDGAGKARLAYLRGRHRGEQRYGGRFRDREHPLGDIINSNPLFVGNQDFGYQLYGPGSALAGESGAYAAFRSSILYRSRPPMIYAGANDGMLHAFHAETGEELFAYVPNAVMGNLSALTSPSYTHRYYVDGSPWSSDVWLEGEWRTVLVGSLGAGGKAIFALDITEPTNFSSRDVLWEFTDSELGFTIGQATIARMANGEWAAIFGNGYESSSQRAQLFIVNLADGSLIRRIDTGAGGNSSPNGLASPIPVDVNGDAVADFIYAGDLLGNLWKFDVTDPSAVNWEIAFGSPATPEPLTTALDDSGIPQPITSKPEVGSHPKGGLMVYFGTGKYFESGDDQVGSNPQTQRFYGIHDDGETADVTRDLRAQNILLEMDHSHSRVRITSSNPVDWTTQKGWYMDLISPANGPQGERVINAPILRYGRVIFTTLIPDADPCKFGGRSWLMELDALTGARLKKSPFDLNHDDRFDEGDYVNAGDLDGDGEDDLVAVSGKQSLDGGISTNPAIFNAGGGKEVKIASKSNADFEVTVESSGIPPGRKSWRQLR